ncbi:MAG: hypothetical protein Q8S20_01005 [Sulfuritalea sp.]|nr:hypothetical protein [Sulfuritalea sp.]
MADAHAWWEKPRRTSVVIDNPSWILPWGKDLVEQLCAAGDSAALVTRQEEVPEGAVAFYLGCLRITPPEVLARNHRNLVVHASDLPQGRGFSPLTYQIMEGLNHIPVCLLDAVEAVDSGPVVYREWIDYAGHELIGELRQKLGVMTVELCRRFMGEPAPPSGVPQRGEPSTYQRRRPADSALDPSQTIAEQFNLLRTVDNDNYPAYFDLYGHRYVIRIEKMEKSS